MKGYILNPDRKYVEKIIDGIYKKQGHCPCRVNVDDTTLCPCDEFVKDGICRCKLYIPNDYSKIFGVVSFNIIGYSASEVGTILDDEFNIYVRTGYHCCPLIHEFIDSINNEGTVRVSLSYFSTKDEINELIKALKTM